MTQDQAAIRDMAAQEIAARPGAERGRLFARIIAMYGALVIDDAPNVAPDEAADNARRFACHGHLDVDGACSAIERSPGLSTKEGMEQPDVPPLAV